MVYRTICVCLVGFVLVKLVKMDQPKAITFKINNIPLDGKPTLICDHSYDKKQQNIYTVLEGETFKIITNYKRMINHFICHDYVDETVKFLFKKTCMRNVTTFTAEKRMGTIWKCNIYTHKDIPILKPQVQYKNSNYSAAYCFMKIHVRQKAPPQTILVNNMVLPALRTNLLEKVIDFIAEYLYADGDVVNVICSNFLNKTQVLTMEYEMAGKVSDKSTMRDMSSSKMIGFVTKLHSGHNNSYMICTNTEVTDYTKVMVTFVMRTKFNIVSISINGMVLRPKLTIAEHNHYYIDYKYVINQPINVTCEVQRTDMRLVVLDVAFDSGTVSSYEKVKTSNKAEMRFSLAKSDFKQLGCVADHLWEASRERVYIEFTAGSFPYEQYPLRMEFQTNGTTMELYNDEYKRNIIFYEFRDGESLKLTCGPLHRENPGPYNYLEFKGSTCNKTRCTITKTLRVTRKNVNTTIVCYLKERHEYGPHTVVREIRVILRERGLTTTTTSSTTSTTTTTTSTTTSTITSTTTSTTPSTIIITTDPASGPASSETSNHSSHVTLISLSAVGGVIVIVILVVLGYVTIKKRCSKVQRSSVPIPAPRPDPATVYYENLLLVFAPINAREASELEPNHYEEIE